ncbi:type I-E CRISPR-associated protein Cse2/CasB [Streptomyces sp. DW26H14]|uniref:type I-E CRISPR-associated protein Cse2/CasB n=1 Tax=Streptomyces sp. DW26H14 TaxID=3435395 RepID=UPI00403D8849
MTSSPSAASEPPKSPARRSDSFVVFVHDLCQTNGTRADLRRGLGLPVERCNYLHRHLVPWLSKVYPGGMHQDAKRAHYAVAALIAARPRIARSTQPVGADKDAPTGWYARANLGAALGQAVGKQVMKDGSAQSALHLMSRQSAESIHPGLPALVRQLLNGGITVDWAVLLEDLSAWNRYRDRVATRWLESYFRISTAEASTPDTPGLHADDNINMFEENGS